MNYETIHQVTMNELNNIPNEEHLSALFISELKEAFQEIGWKTVDVIDETGCGFDVLPPNKKYYENSNENQETSC